jgi:hypothetical protein
VRLNLDIFEASQKVSEYCAVVYLPEEGMALNDTDKGWIKNVIAETLKEHFRGWKEAIRIYSIPSVAVAILIFAFTQWDKYAEFRTRANDRLDSLTGRITEVEKIPDQVRAIRGDLDRLLDKSARETLRAPVASLDKDSATQIKDAAERAVQRKLEVDPVAIQKVSQVLFKNPDKGTWEATLALANLRSFVNTTLAHAKQHVVATLTSPKEVGPPYPAFPTPKPDEWVELVGGTVALDGKPGDRGSIHNAAGVPYSPFRNLIVRNATVTYHGGKATLINVFFENCTFEITDNDNGRRMAEAILDPTPYTSFAGN